MFHPFTPKCCPAFYASTFLSKCQGIKLNVNINNVDFPCVNSTKILGVHFYASLSWKDHVTHVRKKISKNLFLLKSIKCFKFIKFKFKFIKCSKIIL